MVGVVGMVGVFGLGGTMGCLDCGRVGMRTSVSSMKSSTERETVLIMSRLKLELGRSTATCTEPVWI